MQNPYMLFTYTDGRPQHTAQVEAQCSVAHEKIKEGIAQPTAPPDLKTYRKWLDQEDLEEPEGVVGAWAVDRPDEPDEAAEPENIAGEVVGEIGGESEEEEDEDEEDGVETTEDGSEGAEATKEGELPPPTAAAVELAEEHGVDLSTLEGTGRDGRVVVYDVQAAIEDQQEEDEVED